MTGLPLPRSNSTPHLPNATSSTTQQRAPSPLAKIQHLKAYDTKLVKILLLENVHEEARKLLEEEGFQVVYHKKALGEAELKEAVRDVHIIGIRSKTKITKEVIDCAKELQVIGCFCIGTNQVDLEYAAEKAIVVFNSPFSNSRSVAELVIGEIICLARQLTDRSMEMHHKVWKKISAGCYEIRGKTLGIVGYGHIGSQVSVLAEAMGMTVLYYDVNTLMPLGRALPCDSLTQLLENSDFVTLHVPENEDTKGMMDEAMIRRMRQGSYLINNARGSVVDLEALKKAIVDKHLAGTALDVYPTEPSTSPADFDSLMQTCPNVILTPHIGGSTEEAQLAIGQEVALNIIRFMNEGRTAGGVNVPEVELRIGWKWQEGEGEANETGVRITCFHKNIPGVLKEMNQITSDYNVSKQICDSRGTLAYMIADLDTNSVSSLQSLYAKLQRVNWSIKTRVLYR